MTQAPQYLPPACYKHPERPAGSICRRCNRPICPDCMREAPVGWQCDSCVAAGARISPVRRWQPGSTVGRLGRTRMTPVVIGLIVVNVLAFVYEEHESFSLAMEEKYFLIPFLVHVHLDTLITSAFLHLSVTHILLNMVTLAIVGPAVEAEIGRLRFLLVYLLAALGGSVGYYLLAPANVPAAGASGAIFGVMAAYYVLAVHRGWEIQTITVLLGINIAFSFSGDIAWQDHLGGLVFGALTCFAMIWHPKAARPSPVAVTVQALAVSVAALFVLVLLLQIPPGQINL